MPRAVTISLVLAVVVVCVSAADYLRSQTLAMKLLVEGQLPPGEPALVSLAEVAAVDALTLYPQSARMLLSRKLPIDDAAIDAKITITRQSMDAVPSPETIARWSAFCALAGREQEALQLLRPLASRYPPLHHQTLENLARLAGRDARIQALLDTLRAPAR